MISPDKIEEWIREAQERPSSGPLIIRFLANRLLELSDWNEELLSENILLRSGEKVEKYESRISNLEYQLDLLKRQFSGELPNETEAPLSSTEAIRTLIFYNALGDIVRLEIDIDAAVRRTIGRFHDSNLPVNDLMPRVLSANSQEELLFVFDSGRTTKLPINEIPISEPDGLSWNRLVYMEPRGGEELVTILPIGRMSLFEYCVQVTRRAYVKKIKESFFETHIAKDYIGTGVTQKFDKTFDLAFCNAGDLLVLASKEGYLSTIEVDRLPLTIEEVTRLSSSDHIVSSFIIREKDSILLMTNDGKVIHREMSWLEPANSLNAKGKPVFSGRKREAGARIVGAAPVDDSDWAVYLTSTGEIRLQPVSDLFSLGSVKAGDPIEIINLEVIWA